MAGPNTGFDAVIIGAGFYGSAIAIYLSRERGLKNVVLIERESSLMQRASYNNQARVHNGYHYPRSFTTAYRSRINLPRFIGDWPQVVKQDFTKLYAIAKRNSKVTARQFERFCRDIGAPIQLAEQPMRKLFDPHLIEEVFVVQEFAFNSQKLADWARQSLTECGVQVRYQTEVTALFNDSNAALQVLTRDADGSEQQLDCRYVINCTYSGMNQFGGDFEGTQAELKQEITEMPLIKLPAALDQLGITVMDGPFFSIMPFPARSLHTLSHVRYTPHQHWRDEAGINPYEKLAGYHQQTRVEHMLRDVGRYIPLIRGAEYVDSLFEIKTVLQMAEDNDARPILFEKHSSLPGTYSVLGGKIDNIYDVLEKLDEELFVSLD
jgi:glycine/D-amino acid oxidase-like deaminating enzyme